MIAKNGRVKAFKSLTLVNRFVYIKRGLLTEPLI